MKILTVVGARPQFIKASSVSRAINVFNNKSSKKITEVLVHTGQHFDQNMSEVFFKELGIPQPKYNLNISNLPHGAMTGRMIEELEKVMNGENPNFVLVYGDTNSTLAASLAAAKLNLPIIHVEAGLRSGNMNMPEEINRVITDRLSNILFCPSMIAVENLKGEGLKKNVFFVGDVMFDVLKFLQKKLPSLTDLNIEFSREKFCICTLHRQENTDNPTNMKEILVSLNEINKKTPVVFPIHPRTKKLITKYKFKALIQDLKIISPLSYMHMLSLINNSSFLLTDSGGMQKEALYLQRPCITLREETEWVETVDLGLNTLCGSNKDLILKAYQSINKTPLNFDKNPYGNGNSAKQIVEIINKSL